MRIWRRGCKTNTFRSYISITVLAGESFKLAKAGKGPHVNARYHYLLYNRFNCREQRSRYLSLDIGTDIDDPLEFEKVVTATSDDHDAQMNDTRVRLSPC